MSNKEVLLIGVDPAGFDYANSPFSDLTPDGMLAGAGFEGSPGARRKVQTSPGH